jgi:hypothetical protein
VARLKLNGWAITKKIRGRIVFMPDPAGHYPIAGQFNYAFYGTEQSASNIVASMKKLSPRYARAAKVVPVTLEMREAPKLESSRIKGK